MTPTRPRLLDPVLGAMLVVTTGLGLVLFNHGELLHRLPLLRLSRPPQEWWAIPAAVGLILPMLFWSGYRILGLVPVAATVAYGCGIVAYATDRIPDWLFALTLGAYGVAFGALIRHTVRNLPRRLRRGGRNEPRPMVPPLDVGLQVLFVVMLASLAVHWYEVATNGMTPPEWRQTYTWGFFLFGAVVTAFAWVRLFRPFFELCVEPVLWLGYKVRGAGPGLAAAPHHGPLLVVANHACWWDPLFVAKVLPRPVTPMMTAKFFDVWFLRPLMVHTFQVIRVAESAARREAPEIQQAIAALDAGKCVVIFPEGFLRRKDEQTLRRFGRGVWEILKSRPDTPVVTCWIEGGWGSWASYFNGPPTKNKKPDVRRPIGVGVSGPTTVKPGVLEHHLRTRVELMNMVLAARAHLGLPDVPAVMLPGPDEEAPA